MNPLKQLYREGQSVWLDFIRRSLITSGDLNRLIEEDGVRGMTSNPTIFEKAIAGSADYDESLRRVLEKNPRGDIKDLYETLVVEDIQMAADVLRPVYDETNGIDGYVSIEVSPKLANDTSGTVAEARRLWKTIARPNIMIKVPATEPGVLAFEELIVRGVNVNATLMFSLEHYEAIAWAYVRGLGKCEHPERIASVASFFVSRVDSAVDEALDSVGTPESLALRGKVAVANAQLAYRRFKEIFGGDEFRDLAASGARVQRPLWASTSTKNPEYDELLYVESLIGPDTVNTLPPATLNAFRDHGRVAATLAKDVGQAETLIARLGSLGIDLHAITEKLQVDGVGAFAGSFEELLEALKKKRSATLSTRLVHQYQNLGENDTRVRSRLQEWEKVGFTSRLWARDPTLWTQTPLPEIENRLGWLSLPMDMLGEVETIDRFAKEIRREGITHVVLCGMGGSSLAPEVFQNTFGHRKGYPQLTVLDSTHPGAVREVEERIELGNTLFVIASKSGTTLETLSFFKYFWQKIRNETDRPGDHFVAITDPETALESLANERGFRRVFHAPADVGGRFSALSVFGLVPAALIGVRVDRILDGSWAMMDSHVARASGEDNPALTLGATLGELAAAGRDKLTVTTSSGLRALPAWIEQLVAESTGKNGKGIIPVIDEPLGPVGLYGDDRNFVHISLVRDEPKDEGALSSLERAGHPVTRIQVGDRGLLGQEFFRWEVAVAAAGSILGIHPFNQPDVQLAKDFAKQVMGGDEEMPGAGFDDGIETVTADRMEPLQQSIKVWLDSAAAGDYIALQAYLAPLLTVTEAMQQVRLSLTNRTRLATTMGYGPRFLHSTGQLHKGGPATGLFLQIVDEPAEPVTVPDTAYSFGQLIKAQALGDARALEHRGRRVLRVNLGRAGADGLDNLLRSI